MVKSEVNELDRQWATNPRWEAIERGYTAEDVVRLRGTVIIEHTLARMGAQLILSPSSWTVDYSIDETEDPYKEKWIKPYTLLARLYDLVIVGATSVGYIVGGPYEGKKMVGCSLAVDKNGVVARGKFNEFAGDLVMADVSVPDRLEKGTAIGERLKKLGFGFSSPWI